MFSMFLQVILQAMEVTSGKTLQYIFQIDGFFSVPKKKKLSRFRESHHQREEKGILWRTLCVVTL